MNAAPGGPDGCFAPQHGTPTTTGPSAAAEGPSGAASR